MSSIADYSTGSLAEFYTKTAIPNAPKHTGRLPLSDMEEKLSVPKAVLFAPEPSMTSSRVAENVFYRHEETPLNTVFFSQANIDALQTKIHDAVFAMSNGRFNIDRQSDEDLKLIMRSYYLQYAENYPGRVAEELEKLNERVINFSANRIMVEVEAYNYYRKDILDFPAPIANPIDVKIYGTRTGELKSFF
jgi:hypothetical protein